MSARPEMPPPGEPRKVSVTRHPVINRDPTLEDAFKSVPQGIKLPSPTPPAIIPPVEEVSPISPVSPRNETAVTSEPVDYESRLFIPKVQVDFTIPIAGGEMVMSGLYHRVFCSKTVVVLGFDTRCKVSTQFRPPSLIQSLSITVYSGNGTQNFSVFSGGLGFSDKENSMDYTMLIIETKPKPERRQEVRDTVKDNRDIFLHGDDDFEPENDMDDLI